MGPDIDDLIITLAGCDDTASVLLVHIDNLLLGLRYLLGFFLGNDHVVHSHGKAGLGCRRKTKLLKIIKHANRFFLTAMPIAIPNDVPKGTFVHDYIWKPNLVRPNFAENNPANSSLNDLFFLLSVCGVLPKVGVGQADHVVNLHLTIIMREQNLLLRSEQAQNFLFFANHPARLGGEVITAQGDILGRSNDRLSA